MLLPINNRGYAYNETGDYDKAIADCDKAIELDPEDATAYRSRGDAYEEKGDYDKAIKDYDMVLQLIRKISELMRAGEICIAKQVIIIKR